jgi:hypothetical protein
VKESAVYGLDDLLLKLDADISRGAQPYTVIVLLERFADFQQHPDGFISPDAVDTRLGELGFDPTDVPDAASSGAIEFHVDALDPGAAVEKVSEILDAFAARIEVGHKHGGNVRDVFRAAENALVRDVRNPIPLWHRRQVEIYEISRGQLLFAPAGGAIDSAFELVSYLDRSAPATAVAGAWAAVESTLKGPSSPKAAAGLASSIATASYPRAELTALAKSRSKSVPRDYLAQAIWDAESNRQRAWLFAEWLRTDVTLDLQDQSEIAAMRRMKTIITDPAAELSAMRSHMLATMQRLYRQRNLVMHGGRTDAVALRSTLRAAAPIVGAAFDRIAHASFVGKVDPLAFGAQADLSLALVQPGESGRLTSLLEK